VPLNPANNPYTRQNPFPFTAEQRFAGNPLRPDTLVTIKGTRKVQIGPDNTGEALDKIGPQGNGILTSLAFGGSGAASGEDAAGGSSVVNLGIEGDYIASVFPSTGDLFADILADLAMDLNDHDILVTAVGKLLTFLELLPDDQALVFGNTDTALSMFAIATQIPEPSSAAMIVSFALALVAIGAYRRRGNTGEVSQGSSILS
jgi:hypothetical protein